MSLNVLARPGSKGGDVHARVVVIDTRRAGRHLLAYLDAVEELSPSSSKASIGRRRMRACC